MFFLPFGVFHFVLPCLVSLFAGRDDPLDLELPNQWLWDIIDEFLYQVIQMTDVLNTRSVLVK